MEIVSIAATPDRLGPTLGPWPITTTNLLIHGYHNSPEAATASYLEIEKNLDRLCSGLHWPGMRLFIEFPLAIENATRSGWRLKDLLQSLNRTILTIQTHSLGARVACEALNFDVKIDRLILSAAAIDQDSFAIGNEFAFVPKNVRRIDVAFSTNDPVLRDNYAAGTFFKSTAMGRTGSKYLAPNIFNHDYSSQVFSHGGYKECKEYFDMWRMLEPKK